MRCSLGKKKLRHYSRLLGIEFVAGLVRGNTGHRVDLYTIDKKEFCLWPDGTVREYEQGNPFDHVREWNCNETKS